MNLVLVLFVFGTVWTANSDIHSLNYIYTALSKPVGLPGIHEFTALGNLDGRMIDYYDSHQQEKVPKQKWMEERLPKDYWDKGTQSRKSKEQWFKVNVGILMERMHQNNSDLHVLQWRHGCEIETQADGSEKFLQGFDEYSYDGEDFLAFEDKAMQWIAPNRYALPTKRKWDRVEILNRYTKGYLEKECVEWLKTFKTYDQEHLHEQKLPTVYVYVKKSDKAGHAKLTCWATGFLPREITMHIRKDGGPIEHGVETSGVRPNHDDTHQMWKRLEIPEEDKGNYDCFVNHVALTKPIIAKWDKKCADCSTGIGIGIVMGFIIGVLLCLSVVAAVVVILKKKKKIEFHCDGQEGSPPGSMDNVYPPTALTSMLPKEKHADGTGSEDSGQETRSSVSGSEEEVKVLILENENETGEHSNKSDSGHETGSLSSGNNA